MSPYDDNNDMRDEDKNYRLAQRGEYGTTLIYTARRRQITHHRYDAKMDDGYVLGDLAAAAVFYAIPPSHEMAPLARHFWPASWSAPRYSEFDQTLRDQDPVSFRIAELAKAGALIAAEIDRLQRRRVDTA